MKEYKSLYCRRYKSLCDGKRWFVTWARSGTFGEVEERRVKLVPYSSHVRNVMMMVPGHVWRQKAGYTRYETVNVHFTLSFCSPPGGPGSIQMVPRWPGRTCQFQRQFPGEQRDREDVVSLQPMSISTAPKIKLSRLHCKLYMEQHSGSAWHRLCLHR